MVEIGDLASRLPQLHTHMAVAQPVVHIAVHGPTRNLAATVETSKCICTAQHYASILPFLNAPLCIRNLEISSTFTIARGHVPHGDRRSGCFGPSASLRLDSTPRLHLPVVVRFACSPF